jgi:hypothetical protein
VVAGGSGLVPADLEAERGLSEDRCCKEILPDEQFFHSHHQRFDAITQAIQVDGP